MTKPYIANTDRSWFEFLASCASQTEGVLDEVNFWLPKDQRKVRLALGTPLLFRLKSPVNAIAGYGFFAHSILLSLDEAWDSFGEANGVPDRLRFLEVIGRYRGEDLISDFRISTKPVGCMVLRDAHFWPQELWQPWGPEQGWAKNIVQGKAEKDPARASFLLSLIQRDQVEAPDELRLPDFTPLNVDERELVLAPQVRRVGQSTFRTRLFSAYNGQCAITGEHTSIVLDAAHIQPYRGPRSNHVQNGLLLTKEFHSLFDKGYVTVTPEHEVKVSPRLRTEWDNGHRYYPYDGQPIRIPKRAEQQPSPEVLDWHNCKVFRD